MFDRLWVYDGDHRLFSLDPSMNRVEEYAYAPGIDQPIATIRGNTGVDAVGYHVQDELGNILGIIENGAYISQTNSYDAWGTPTETGHAYNNQLKWKGLKWEGDVISLYYMRNRWYDYETGRFMSEDPIGLSGGINLYAFANNDPVNGRDPYGLDPCTAESLAEGWVTVTIDGKEWCGLPQPLPPVQILGWGFSTPRNQGWSNNSGERGAWWNPTGYGDENWNSGNGSAGFGGKSQQPQVRRPPASGAITPALSPIDLLAGALAAKGVVTTGRTIAYGAFRPGGWLNSGQHLRIGIGRHEGSEVFRIAGDWIKRLPEQIQNEGHIDLWIRGPWGR